MQHLTRPSTRFYESLSPYCFRFQVTVLPPGVPPPRRPKMPTRVSHPPPGLFSWAPPSPSSPYSSELGSLARTRVGNKKKETGSLPSTAPCNSSPSSMECPRPNRLRISLLVLDRRSACSSFVVYHQSAIRLLHESVSDFCEWFQQTETEHPDSSSVVTRIKLRRIDDAGRSASLMTSPQSTPPSCLREGI